jgi:hypothetical protein
VRREIRMDVTLHWDVEKLHGISESEVTHLHIICALLHCTSDAAAYRCNVDAVAPHMTAEAFNKARASEALYGVARTEIFRCSTATAGVDDDERDAAADRVADTEGAMDPATEEEAETERLGATEVPMDAEVEMDAMEGDTVLAVVAATLVAGVAITLAAAELPADLETDMLVLDVGEGMIEVDDVAVAVEIAELPWDLEDDALSVDVGEPEAEIEDKALAERDDDWDCDADEAEVDDGEATPDVVGLEEALGFVDVDGDRLGDVDGSALGDVDGNGEGEAMAMPSQEGSVAVAANPYAPVAHDTFRSMLVKCTG